jgi:Na+-transporting methylmalonyl-CoA/oxaloacetate decarboxylase gamma subunit
MTSSLSIALQITLAGMGLVFLALAVLWGAMELLVRLSSPPRRRPAAPLPLPDFRQYEDEELARKRQAAVAGLTLALSEGQTELHEFPMPPTALVSAWQAVNRTNMLNKRGQVR